MTATRMHKGVYILPNLLTTAGLFAGFYAILQGVDGRFEHASLAIFVAIVLDGLDGRVARWTHTESHFGAEYDSLADMVSFGLAPALLIYLWALNDIGQLGWLAAFIYATGAGLRLARFNSQLSEDHKRYFVGLPSPSAAALVAGLILTLQSYGAPGTKLAILSLITTIVAGTLMVSNIHYRSFKDLDRKDWTSYAAVLGLLVLLMLIVLDPLKAMFGLVAGYVLSGPVIASFSALRRVIAR